MPSIEYKFHCFGSSFSVYTIEERNYFIKAFGIGGNHFTIEEIKLYTTKKLTNLTHPN